MRRLTLALRAEGALDRLATAPRPVGLRRAGTLFEIFRDTYFDTDGGDLAERELALRLRLSATGRRSLALIRRLAVTLEGVVDREVVEIPLRTGLYEALRGEGEIARAVREITVPEALRPVVALDVDREVQELRPGFFGHSTHRAVFDRIQVHRGEESWLHWQLSLQELRPARVTLEELADRAEGHGVVARRELLDLVQEQVGSGRGAGDAEGRGAGLSLVAVSSGRLALLVSGSGLALPKGGRSGEAEATRVAGEVLAADPDAPPDLDLVGFAAPEEGEDVEVWLAEGVAADPGGEVVWLPLFETLERVGSPGLRDPALVESLLLLVRSRVGQQLLEEWSGRPPPSASRALAPSRPAGVAPGADAEDFLDADLSILDFNLRVLEMAEDPDVPLLERFRYVAIFASNLDEFFVVRVARLKTHAERGMLADDAALPAGRLLDAVAVRVRALLARQEACLQGLFQELERRGIGLRSWSELDDRARAELSQRFERELFPALMPQAMTGSSGQPFPRVESLSLSLAVLVAGHGDDRPHVAHLPIPTNVPRFLPVPGSADLVAVEEVVAAHARRLFPGSERAEAHPFRVSRIADVTVDSELAESLLESVADEVANRRYQPVVRLEVSRTMPREVRAHLLRELRAEAAASGGLLGRGDVYETDAPLDLGRLGEIADLDVPGGTFGPFVPRDLSRVEGGFLDQVAAGDVFVHHPYDSFGSSVGRFLEEAASDPRVVSIRMTLYRTGRDGQVVRSLLKALSAGKEVAVFVELQARFDEERNIEWTHRLQNAGGHVVFGVPGFKTHAKTALVVRREASGELVRFCHVGTGNYNESTSGVYTDFGLFSADPELGGELNSFFNELTGSSGPPVGRHETLWVAPHGMLSPLLDRIHLEAEHARAGRPSGIRAKMNGLSDRAVVEALYQASGAGVPIELVVRSICTLRPGVPGLSAGIQVRSLLGRFLEHGRVYRFENGGDPVVYMGSADWRKRNLRRRVEVAARVRDPEVRARLDGILDIELGDPRAWVLGADGRYRRMGGSGPSAQQRFMARDTTGGTASAG